MLLLLLEGHCLLGPQPGEEQIPALGLQEGEISPENLCHWASNWGSRYPPWLSPKLYPQKSALSLLNPLPFLPLDTTEPCTESLWPQPSLPQGPGVGPGLRASVVGASRATSKVHRPTEPRSPRIWALEPYFPAIVFACLR